MAGDFEQHPLCFAVMHLRLGAWKQWIFVLEMRPPDRALISIATASGLRMSFVPNRLAVPSAIGRFHPRSCQINRRGKMTKVNMSLLGDVIAFSFAALLAP